MRMPELGGRFPGCEVCHVRDGGRDAARSTKPGHAWGFRADDANCLCAGRVMPQVREANLQDSPKLISFLMLKLGFL